MDSEISKQILRPPLYHYEIEVMHFFKRNSRKRIFHVTRRVIIHLFILFVFVGG